MTRTSICALCKAFRVTLLFFDAEFLVPVGDQFGGGLQEESGNDQEHDEPLNGDLCGQKSAALFIEGGDRTEVDIGGSNGDIPCECIGRKQIPPNIFARDRQIVGFGTIFGANHRAARQLIGGGPFELQRIVAATRASKATRVALDRSPHCGSEWAARSGFILSALKHGGRGDFAPFPRPVAETALFETSDVMR